MGEYPILMVDRYQRDPRPQCCLAIPPLQFLHFLAIFPVQSIPSPSRWTPFPLSFLRTRSIIPLSFSYILYLSTDFVLSTSEHAQICPILKQISFSPNVFLQVTSTFLPSKGIIPIRVCYLNCLQFLIFPTPHPIAIQLLPSSLSPKLISQKLARRSILSIVNFSVVLIGLTFELYIKLQVTPPPS